jgi:hypothetical protein
MIPFSKRKKINSKTKLAILVNSISNNIRKDFGKIIQVFPRSTPCQNDSHILRGPYIRGWNIYTTFPVLALDICAEIWRNIYEICSPLKSGMFVLYFVYRKGENEKRVEQRSETKVKHKDPCKTKILQYLLSIGKENESRRVERPETRRNKVETNGPLKRENSSVSFKHRKGELVKCETSRS